MIEPLIECIPNFSEGRDTERIAAIVSAVEASPGVRVLDQTSDWDHNRTVVTFAGGPIAVVQAAVRATAEAAKLIDLNLHRGVHPRVGAVDVLPFVPLRSATLEDCARLARWAGERISSELGIPIYFYAAAATRPERIALEDIRRGQFEGLRDAVVEDPERRPDLGGPGLHPTAGAVIVGARKILIAFNVDLQTADLGVARGIARQIRASGGGFPAVKALGLPLLSRNLVQVSINLTDFEQTPLHIVYEEVVRLAALQGVGIEKSELIGLLPKSVMERGFAHFIKLPEFAPQKLIETQIAPLTFDRVEVPGLFLPGERLC